jgi:hypothetical protein
LGGVEALEPLTASTAGAGSAGFDAVSLSAALLLHPVEEKMIADTISR